MFSDLDERKVKLKTHINERRFFLFRFSEWMLSSLNCLFWKCPPRRQKYKQRGEYYDNANEKLYHEIDIIEIVKLGRITKLLS